ncbi:MAG: SMR family transporter [Spirulina sp.]
MFFLVLIMATVALNTLAQILLKAGSGQFLLNPYLLGGIAAYGLSTLMYISVLGKLNLSLAYPLIIGLTTIATTVAGAHFFQEKVEPMAWVGIGLMLSGISALTLGRR